MTGYSLREAELNLPFLGVSVHTVAKKKFPDLMGFNVLKTLTGSLYQAEPSFYCHTPGHTRQFMVWISGQVQCKEPFTSLLFVRLLKLITQTFNIKDPVLFYSYCSSIKTIF